MHYTRGDSGRWRENNNKKTRETTSKNTTTTETATTNMRGQHNEAKKKRAAVYRERWKERQRMSDIRIPVDLAETQTGKTSSIRKR